MKRLILIFVYSITVHGFLFAAEPELKPEDFPRVPPTELADVFKKFQIKKGYEIQLVAGEPLVVDPIAVSFDEDGRMYVVEMRDYSERRDEKLGRIRLLEDTNGDGVYDTSKVFLENLAWPTAVTCTNGGILVGAAPEIIWAKDTNGDGVADERKVVFTGFGNIEKLNVQAQFNNMQWAIDNRIHGCGGLDGGNVMPTSAPTTQLLDVRGKNFVIDPRNMSIALENGGGQYGLSFDPYGQWFTSSNSRHIMTFMYDMRYAGMNPHYVMPSPLVDIPVDGPAAEVYRISPEEPWRVIRTKWRVTGIVPGIIEGGGRSAGYFTGATGVTIYRGDAMKELVGDSFTGDAGGNLVHHKKIRRDGVAYVAERPADELKVEFLASSDNWFRPVDFANAPDGSLYVIDMYRETIEHPWSLPPGIKKYLDLNSGNDRGRIYRVISDGFANRAAPKLSKATTDELIALLEHPNAWHRETALRLLFERQDKSAIPRLNALMQRSSSDASPLYAMSALRALDALDRFHISRGMSDRDPQVRARAIPYAEQFIAQGRDVEFLQTRLETLAKDPDITVRYQLALTVGKINHPHRMMILGTFAQKDLTDPWMVAAILNSLPTGAAELFEQLSISLEPSTPGRANFFAQLAKLIGAENDPKQIAQILKRIDSSDQPATKVSLGLALASGLRGADHNILDAGPLAESLMSQAKSLASDAKLPESIRIDAIALLGFGDFADTGPVVAKLLDTKEPQGVQLAAIDAMETFASPKVADDVLTKWTSLSPRVRSEALAMLLKRPARATALLNAIEKGKVRGSDLDGGQVHFLQTHPEADVRAAAKKVLAAAPTTQRQEVIDAFMPALKLKGDATAGKKIYQERCLSCHRVEDQGYALGPDLMTVRNFGAEKMLINILEPNRELAANYTAYLVESKDGESVVGLMTNETPASVTIRQAYGRESTIARDRIKRIRSEGRSMMPEGLETGLKPQDFADLLEYLTTAGK